VRPLSPPNGWGAAEGADQRLVGLLGRILLATTVILGVVVHGAASAQGAGASPLRFGIYPNAGVGTVDPIGGIVPEDELARWDALKRLRGSCSRPFVLHLYTGWDGRRPFQEVMSGVDGDIATANAHGFLAEVVLRYRPDRSLSTRRAVGGYVQFVRAAVRHLGRARNVVGVQVTNEANVPGQPDASDGDYAGIERALVRGVRAAKHASRRARRPDIGIGFTVSAEAPMPFWRRLRVQGRRSFGRAVDWVGVDLYPQTWTSTAERGPGAAAAAMRAELRRLRRVALPIAGIPRGVRLHISENGFPTGPTRDETEQAGLLTAAIKAVAAARRQYGVSDYRWFGLRDANSSEPSFEAQYGVLHDDYTPKPGFESLRDLIDRLGSSSAPSHRRGYRCGQRSAGVSPGPASPR
jgi:hypothetical protein